MLKGAKDACAAEALQIATYTALERLAVKVGDQQTAQLAGSIRFDEEMLERVMREIPKLTDAVVSSELEADPSHDVGKTGAADAMRELASDVQQTARNKQTHAKRAAQTARKAPGSSRSRDR